jgi:hypothetical protein
MIMAHSGSQHDHLRRFVRLWFKVRRTVRLPVILALLSLPSNFYLLARTALHKAFPVNGNRTTSDLAPGRLFASFQMSFFNSPGSAIKIANHLAITGHGLLVVNSANHKNPLQMFEHPLCAYLL